jgi:hypothetical protein
MHLRVIGSIREPCSREHSGTEYHLNGIYNVWMFGYLVEDTTRSQFGGAHLKHLRDSYDGCKNLYSELGAVYRKILFLYN